jgi:hypothetical protein
LIFRGLILFVFTQEIKRFNRGQSLLAKPFGQRLLRIFTALSPFYVTLYAVAY